MYYGYIYKITNLINNKIYIGKKKSSKFLGKEYMGSGKRIRRAVAKYGVENFDIEAIDWAETKEEQNKQEKYWIKFYRDSGSDLYNIANGGDGGDMFAYLNDEERAERLENRKIMYANLSEEVKREIVNKRNHTIKINGIKPGAKSYHKPWNKGLTKDSDARIAAVAQARREFSKNNPGYFSGYKHSPEAIEKIRAASIGNNHGIGNRSIKGYKHMYKGTVNANVPPDRIQEYLADGWIFGCYRKPRELYNSIKIQCLETGLIYASISEAERSLDISSYYIKKCCKTGADYNGYHFKFI